MVSSATWMCSSVGRSKVEATTVDDSFLSHRFMSVTSSGRSSTSSTNRWTSGLLTSIDRAICFMIVVLPALGGDTMRPRWPLPIGDSRSTIRAVMFVGSDGFSRVRRVSGNSGVRSSKLGRSRALSGSSPFTRSIRSSAGFFSLRSAGRLAPFRWSPLRSPNWRACLTDT